MVGSKVYSVIMPTGLMQDIIKAFKHTPWFKCIEIVRNAVYRLPTDCYWWRRGQIYSPVLQSLSTVAFSNLCSSKPTCREWKQKKKNPWGMIPQVQQWLE